MKKIAFALVALVVSCISLNAQVAESAFNLNYKGGSFYQNGTKLTPEQLCSVIGRQTFDEVYKPAKNLRTAGVAVLSTGCGVTAVGAGLVIGGIIEGSSKSGSATAGTISTGVGVIIAGCGAVTAITGGILMGCANKKMKSIIPASNGAGLAFVF